MVVRIALAEESFDGVLIHGDIQTSAKKLHVVPLQSSITLLISSSPVVSLPQELSLTMGTHTGDELSSKRLKLLDGRVPRVEQLNSGCDEV